MGDECSHYEKATSRMPIPALISCSSGHQRHLEFDVIVGPGDANGITAAHLDSTIVLWDVPGCTGFDNAWAVVIDST